jgi:hypothetical protein
MDALTQRKPTEEVEATWDSYLKTVQDRMAEKEKKRKFMED